MLKSLKPIIIPPYLQQEIDKKLCFANNLRAKNFTIALVVYSLFISTYDVVFNQRIHQQGEFLSQFKLDLILIVFSVIFTIYIFFNQVKSAKHIKSYHRIIHTIISFFLLCWGAAKACNSSFSQEILIQVYLISVFITVFMFYFPFYNYLFQLLLSIFFYIFMGLYYQIEIDEIFRLGFFNLLLIMIAFLISRFLVYQKTEYFLKEYEIFRLKDEKQFTNGQKEKPE
jgi:hypothetical protein